MERERKLADERFQSKANLRNGGGVIDRAFTGKLFKKKISSIDAAHEEALEDNKKINETMERHAASEAQITERDKKRREKYDAIQKEIDALEVSRLKLEVSSPDSSEIALIKREIEAKRRAQGMWGQLR
jgi:flagellar motility protein MotE (MotC chaperone)